MKAAIIDTGCANLPSVEAALRRAGLEPVLADSVASVLESPYVVLPGVGAFGPAVEQLRRQNLESAIWERVVQDQPTLAICVGLQMLGAGSEESPGVPGLGILPCRAARFDAGVRIPHMGWNRVTGEHFGEGYAYFANSYRIDEIQGAALETLGWRVAWTGHGGRFVAAVARGSVLACQFHPELSGTWGADLLRSWVAREVVKC
jgi:imidazole glycerol phosphate synthase glutamine amidotransferase subunit